MNNVWFVLHATAADTCTCETINMFNIPISRYVMIFDKVTQYHIVALSIGGSKGTRLRIPTSDPNSFNFMQFLVDCAAP